MSRDQNPHVEIVEFKGITFRRYPSSPRRSDRVYFAGYDSPRRLRLHVAVWEHHNGPVPEGALIHHLDGNPLNNDISNLECIPGATHMGLHEDMLPDEFLAWRQEHLERIRPLSVEWHRSEEGRRWHSQHGIEAFQTRKPMPRTCDHCGKEFGSMAHRDTDRFCSNACKSAWRRASGIDNEKRACAKCGTLFDVNKYSKVRFCSPSCSASRPRQKGLTRQKKAK